MSEALIHGGFFNWMMDVLRGIASIRTPFLDGVMSGVTWLGQEMAFIIIGVIILWCVDKKYGYRFLFMFMSGTFLNQLLKAIFAIPRPWKIDESFKPVESAIDGASGWSFPSGHTQAAVLMYGGLAQRIKKAWAYILAGVLILLVGFSRMYLGVHTLLDVGVSLILGVAIIAFCELFFNKVGDGLTPYAIMTGITALLSLGLLIYLRKTFTGDYETEYSSSALHDGAVLFGVAFGLFAGSFVEKKFINFDTRAAWWVQIIKVVIGIALIMGLRIGLKPLLSLVIKGVEKQYLCDAIRYFAMSFAALGIYPIFFKLFRKRSK